MMRGTIKAILLAAGLVSSWGGGAFAQQADRSPQAQDALTRGFAMAQQQQWRLAIKYFKSAQSFSPRDPVVLFNLALATDRAGGRDLAAAAWYRAFLGAAPGANNSKQVRDRVLQVEIEAEAQILKLLETAVAIERQLPRGEGANPSETKARQAAVLRVAQARAAAGETGPASQALAQVPAGRATAWAQAAILAALAHERSPMEAQRQVAAIQAVGAKSWAQAEVAVAMASRKDFAGALDMAREIKVKSEAAWSLSRIAGLQAHNLDTAGARETLKHIPEGYNGPLASARAVLAVALAKAGDTAGAAQETEAAIKAFDAIGAGQDRLIPTVHLIQARSATGDRDGARKLVAAMPEARERYLALKAIAAQENDIAGAEIYRWTAIALQAESGSAADTRQVLMDAKTQPPYSAMVSLAMAAEHQARLLREFRRIE